MKKSTIIKLSALALTLVAVILLACLLPKTTMLDCEACGATGVVANNSCEACGGNGEVAAESWYYSTFMALIPPIVAITLALITKEVYSSLFLGIVLGALFASNYSFAGTVDKIVSDGLIATVSDTAGIFIFLVILGIIVAMLNKAGGAQAFGLWAQKHIKTKVGALLATFALGVLIFIDDYFNCLTVGSVMRPVTDGHKVSRVKLAYIIDATAAPICMIAPISSWAAAVSSYVESDTMSGIEMFIRAIPFNFYSLLTILFVVLISILGIDYGKMSEFEIKAGKGDLLGDGSKVKADEKPETDKSCVWDLIVPIILLIVFCVGALLYVGGLFSGESFVDAFANTDATVGLPWGALLSLLAIMLYFYCRGLLKPKAMMDCVPQGFIAMVPAILILTFATSLKNMTALLGAKEYVKALMDGAAAGLASFLPAIIFLVACVLAFATGTSWGTFGILIPIVTGLFAETDPIFFVGISACLAGAVCGDHCSPISDTTIMASAGAECNHLNHVATQLPYAITVAAVSFVSYIIAGFLPNAWIMLPIASVLLVGAVLLLRYWQTKQNKAAE